MNLQDDTRIYFSYFIDILMHRRTLQKCVKWQRRIFGFNAKERTAFTNTTIRRHNFSRHGCEDFVDCAEAYFGASIT